MITNYAECREYEEAKYEKVWTSVGFNDKPVLERVLHCATSNVPLVVGGEIAIPGEFPHMVHSLTVDFNVFIFKPNHIFTFESRHLLDMKEEMILFGVVEEV